MWYFQPYPQRLLQFNFEPTLREIDENEKICHQRFIEEKVPPEEQATFQKTVGLHWIRSLCNKGDHCKFLHECDREKMTKCWFWERFHECSNFECVFRHDRVEMHDEKCKFYVRGFCRHGNKCKRKHALKDSICLNYLAGFCPEGPNCIFAHAKWVEEDV